MALSASQLNDIVKRLKEGDPINASATTLEDGTIVVTAVTLEKIEIHIKKPKGRWKLMPPLSGNL